MHLVTGDRRAADDFPDIGFHAVLSENIGQYLRLRLGLALKFAHVRRVRHVQEFDVRQLVRRQVALIRRHDHRHWLLLRFGRRSGLFRRGFRRKLRLRNGNFDFFRLYSLGRLRLFLIVKLLLQLFGGDCAEKRDYPAADFADAKPQKFQNGSKVLVEEQRQGAN